MNVTVDAETCVGCGLCVDNCPDVFEMDGDIARVIVESVPADVEEECKEAADACPVDAIAIED